MATSKFTDETTAEIVNLISNFGMKRNAAAKYVGISPSTLTKWIKRGRKTPESEEDEIYVQFVRDIEAAEAKHERRLLGVLDDGLYSLEGGANPGVAIHLLKARHQWGSDPSKFVDYLVSKLADDHSDLLEDILNDISNGAID